MHKFWTREVLEVLSPSKDMQIKDKIDYSVNIIENLGRFFQTASPETKILLLGSIFPEKIEYDGKNYRTNSYNKEFDVIYQETNYLRSGKEKDSPEKSGEYPSRFCGSAEGRGVWGRAPLEN